MKQQRLDAIERYVNEKRSVTLDKLCEEFGISKNTVRRDIDILIPRGTIKKVYGGVTAVKKDGDIPGLLPYESRHVAYISEKDKICRLAASYVREGDTIYIDTGTTCVNMVKYISDRSCTIITNSLQVCTLAVPYPKLRVLSLPGQLKRETLSFTGNTTTEYLSIYNIQKAFMACTGCSLEHGLTNASSEEYIIKKTVIENSQMHFLLADHSKFGRFSLMTYCHLEDIDKVITDCPLPEEYQSFCIEHGIEVICD